MIPTPLLVLVLKATLILLAAMGVTRVLARASAGTRHLVWLVALAGLLLLPVLDAWGPVRVAILPAAAPGSVATRPEAPPVDPTAQRSAAVAPASASSAPAPLPTEVQPGPASGLALPSVGPLGVALLVWGAVTLVLLLVTAWAWLAVHRIVRGAQPLDTRDWLDPLYEVADRFGLREAPRLLRSEAARMPFACGVLRPTIVLPAESDGWTAERRRAVLLHELAHVRRRDLAGHTLARFACAVYWFHPLVWTAAKALRNESERACDDMALACGAHAPDYAEHLLEIVTSVRADHTPVVALAMARRSEFEGRMLAILDPERPRAAPGWRQVAALTTVFGLMAITIGAASPVQRQLPPIDRGALLVKPEAPRPADTGASAAARAIAKAEMAPLRDGAREVTLGEWERIRDREKEKAKALEGKGKVALEELQDPRVDDRPELLARILTSDTSVTLRRVAAWGLAEHMQKAVAEEALARAVRRDPSPIVREMAAWALAEGDKGSGAITEALVAALRDSDAKVRATAAWALGNLEDRGAVDALAAALGDADLEVRVRAAWAIGATEPARAPAALLAALGAAEPRLRRMAAWALYAIEDPAAVPALQRALGRETEKELEIDYIRALAAMGEHSVEAVKTLLDSRDPRVRDMAVRALAGGSAGGPWPMPWPMPRPYP